MDSVSELDFDSLINRDQLVVIDFSATWCGPCRRMAPILERVAEKMENIEFYNLDVDENEDIAKRYRIFSVPTLVCFKNGKKIDTMVGLNSLEDIIAFINRCDETEDVEED